MEFKESIEYEAATLFPEMLLRVEDPLKEFTKKLYEDSFRKYQKQYEKHLNAIETLYKTSPNPADSLNIVADSMIEAVQKELSTMKKRHQEDKLMIYSMILVTYVNPALIDSNPESGNELVNIFLKKWKEAFPKSNLKSSTFEAINGGFKKRFCYITTAVCESMNKPDDCYELSVLRNYRDDYLQQLETGELLIQEYYDIAPTIVKHIDALDNAKEIYRNIWTDYLSPCIQLIEADRNQECQDLYRDMVYDLKERYFN